MNYAAWADEDFMGVVIGMTSSNRRARATGSMLERWWYGQSLSRWQRFAEAAASPVRRGGRLDSASARELLLRVKRLFITSPQHVRHINGSESA
jgi:hypothetical protein